MFILCYKGLTKDNRVEIYPIYESSLKNIDMYTSYKFCNSKDDLFKLLPAEVKEFIYANFKENKYSNKEINGAFFVRKKCENIKRGRTDLNILYSNDTDIVYADLNDIYFALTNMMLEYGDDENAILKKNFFIDLYKLIKNNHSITNEIDKNNEAYNNYDSRIKSISNSIYNLKIIAKAASNDYLLKRKILALLKDYRKNFNSLDNTNYLVVSQNKLKSKIESRPFSILNATFIMKKMLSESKRNLDNKVSEETDIYLTYSKSDYEDSATYDTLYSDENEEDFDDFLGPLKPNDRRYWGIN